MSVTKGGSVERNSGNGRAARTGRRWWFRAAALLAALAAAEGALQVATRLSPACDQAIHPWRPPRATGPRTPPVIDVRAPDIAVIGDSQTYGTGVELPEAWPALVGKALGREVHNFAWPGHGPVEYRKRGGEALAARPRLLIVGVYTGNDLLDGFQSAWRNEGNEEERGLAHAPGAGARERASSADAEARAVAPAWTPPPLESERPSAFRAVLDRSALGALLRSALWRLRGTKATDPRDRWDRWLAVARAAPGRYLVVETPAWRTILSPAYRFLTLDPEDPRIQAGAAIAESALEDLGGRCGAAGVRLLVVLIPTKEAVFDPFLDDGLRTPACRQLAAAEAVARDRLKACCRRSGIECVDVLPALQSVLREANPYFERPDGHPAAAGHRAIAAAVYRSL